MTWSSSSSSPRGWFDAELEEARDRLRAEPRARGETGVERGLPDRLGFGPEPDERHDSRIELANADEGVGIADGDGAAETRDDDGELGRRQRIVGTEPLDRGPHETGVDDRLDLGRCELGSRAPGARRRACSDEQRKDDEQRDEAAAMTLVSARAPRSESAGEVKRERTGR